MYEDLVRKLLDLSAVENVLVTQPCRDNMLYLLKLVDEMLLSEMKFNLPVHVLFYILASLPIYLSLFSFT